MENVQKKKIYQNHQNKRIKGGFFFLSIFLFPPSRKKKDGIKKAKEKREN